MDLLTIAEVAAIMRHPAPDSRAAVEMVRRLVRQGLPRLPGGLFDPDQVRAWLREQAQARAAARVPHPVSTRRRKPAQGTIAERVAELRASGR